MNFTPEDHKWMKLALQEAKKATQIGEVPIGAVLVGPEGLLAKAHNRRETWKTPIGHAEIIALHRASKKRQNWRLLDTTLYVTLEPCVMCAGALVLARVKRIVFAALDPKGGGSKSLYTITEDARLNHQIQVEGGLMEKDAAELLKSFFKMRRQENKRS
jgi:tRNA(adenine34) deaminase